MFLRLSWGRAPQDALRDRLSGLPGVGRPDTPPHLRHYPAAVARRGQDDGARLRGLRRELPLMAVLLVVSVGLLLGVLSRWRTGAVALGAAVLLAGLLRLLLPARQAGLLVVRSRRLDVAVLLVLGVALVALATSVPAPVLLPEAG